MATYTLRTKLWLFFLSTALLLYCCTLMTVPVLGAGSISQGFKADDQGIEVGALVTHQAGKKTTLKLANTSQDNQLVGVVGEKPLLELSGDGQEVQVVVSGSTQTFVSNINGNVKAGDRIAASPISGVGMKATEDTQVVGTAQADLESTDTSTQTVTDRNGKKETIRLGLLPVQIDVGYYVAPKDKLATFLPGFLQALANNTAGKNVSSLRILISTLALLLGFITSAIILYSSVRSGIISIGRNPLARTVLLRGLFEILLTAGGILIITAIIVYLILTS